MTSQPSASLADAGIGVFELTDNTMKSHRANQTGDANQAPAPPPVAPLLVTRKQAAAVLGLKEGTLRTWASLGRGPRYKKLHSGSRAGVRYSVDELRAYAEDPAAYERRRNGL
jgi:hypothetical protein